MIWFLVVMGLVWLVAASVFDIRKREIPNWLSFSLIAVALVYRIIFSVINWDFNFLLQGLFGLGIFVGLGYLFYYARVFAGGDAKLLMGLGAILAFSSIFKTNLIIFAVFLFLMLVAGAVYGLVYSTVLAVINKKAFLIEFKKQVLKYKIFFYISVLFALFLALILFLFKLDLFLFLLALLVLLFPVLMSYGKAIEEACLIKEIKPGKLTEGDWLHENVVIGKKVIKPYWEGLSAKDIGFIKKYGKNKKVLIKQGIPFVPVFLIAYLLFLFLWYSNWEFWQYFYLFFN